MSSPENPHLKRALLLQEQGRHDMAEQELRQFLAQNPDSGPGHAALSVSLDELKRFDDSEQAARRAIELEPDIAFGYYALARVLVSRHRLGEASQAIRECIRMEPMDADFHALLAAIEFQTQNWKEALQAAEEGLKSDPEHVTCNNLRAMALVKLGRKQEAGATIESTLQRDPDNPHTHANQGWTFLEKGNRREAMHHFKESLRLDPNNEWARSGLVEAIKAGNPFYAIFLKYLLWMQKLPSGVRFAIIFGGYFGNRMLGQLAQSNPEWAPWIRPIRIAYTVFALFTWLANPIFNLMLFLHPVGKHALDSTQKAQASWVGLCLGMSVCGLFLWLLAGRDSNWLTPALMFGILAIPVSAIHTCHEGWPRKTMAGISTVLALSALVAIGIEFIIEAPRRSHLAAFGDASATFYFVGVFISQWIVQWLSQQVPAR